MYAVGLDAWGGPQVLHTVDLPTPFAGPEQVLVRVSSAGVAPVDVMARTGLLKALYEGQQPPFVPGMEIAGTVEDIGAGLDPHHRLTVGTPVVAFVDFAGSHGGYSELLALPTESVIRAPKGLTMPEAATTVLNPLTARNVLDALALPPGSTLLVTGAAGAVGGYLVQLATLEGLQVVAQGRPGDEDLLRKFGAGWFVSRDDDLVPAVRDLLPEGVDAAVDTAAIGGTVTGAIRDGGQYAALRHSVGQADRDIAVHGLNVRQRATDRAALEALRDLVEQGALTVRLGEVVPASEAPRAHELLESGARGRVVLDLAAF
jgi:zinc-binding alcohol dehydrogenase